MVAGGVFAVYDPFDDCADVDVILRVIDERGNPVADANTLACGGRLSSWRVRRPNASMPLCALCVRRRRRGDAERLGGGSASDFPRGLAVRAGRWDNAPYRRRRTRGTGAPPAW